MLTNTERNTFGHTKKTNYCNKDKSLHEYNNLLLNYRKTMETKQHTGVPLKSIGE